MKWKPQLLLITALILALIPLAWQPATAQERKPRNRVLAHALDIELGRVAPARTNRAVAAVERRHPERPGALGGLLRPFLR